MSINKLTLHVAIYATDPDSTTGHWKSYNMMDSDDTQELKMLIEILENEPESLGDYNIFKKIKILKEKINE